MCPQLHVDNKTFTYEDIGEPSFWIQEYGNSLCRAVRAQINVCCLLEAF